jgi:aspartate aminotransferase
MKNSFTASRHVSAMQGSSTMKAAQAASALRDKGVDVIDLTLGEPDFDTPQFVKDFAIEGLQKGLTKYTPTPGLKSFRESVANFYAKEFSADVSPNEIIATCGGKQALFNAVCTLVNHDDEVLIPKPYWVTFPEIVNFVGAKNVFVETEASEFVLTADEVKRAITPKTKLLILNSPNNPTGRVIPASEMIRIVEACAESGVYVLTDECYLFFVYPPAQVFSGTALPRELRQFVCVAGSFSKTYAMTGWRIGHTVANESWTREMSKLQSHSTSHPTSFVQHACARAMQEREKSAEAVSGMLAEYKKRRDWLIPALREIKGLKVANPEGAFYAFVDVRGLLDGNKFKSSSDVAEKLLNDAHVVVTDGEGFGANGFLRLSYATSIENLKKAVELIKRVL